MSDNTEPPSGLVAELRARAERGGTNGIPYSSRAPLLEAADLVERHEARGRIASAALVARAETAEKRLGELLAVIFGDGGHRQADIGDDAEAVRQAHERIATDRQQLEAVCEVASRMKARGDNGTPCDDYHKGYKFACRGAVAEIMTAIEKGTNRE